MHVIFDSWSESVNGISARRRLVGSGTTSYLVCDPTPGRGRPDCDMEFRSGIALSEKVDALGWCSANSNRRLEKTRWVAGQFKQVAPTLG
jgi:hypothetical protein